MFTTSPQIFPPNPTLSYWKGFTHFPLNFAVTSTWEKLQSILCVWVIVMADYIKMMCPGSVMYNRKTFRVYCFSQWLAIVIYTPVSCSIKVVFQSQQYLYSFIATCKLFSDLFVIFLSYLRMQMFNYLCHCILGGLIVLFKTREVIISRVNNNSFKGVTS